MADITDYLEALTMGSNATTITGKPADGFVAGGFAAFVQALTGKLPTLVTLPNKKAKIILDEKQTVIMRKWLDTQMWTAIKRPEQSLTLEMNPVVVPWALKYIVPAALLCVVAGWLGHYYLAR